MFKLITALTVALMLLVVAMPTTAFADEARQSQEQKLEIECTTGNYGQSTCKAKGEQKQEQVIKRGDRYIVKHQTVNTGIPSSFFAAVVFITVLGVVAVLAKRK